MKKIMFVFGIMLCMGGTSFAQKKEAKKKQSNTSTISKKKKGVFFGVDAPKTTMSQKERLKIEKVKSAGIESKVTNDSKNGSKTPNSK